MNVTMATLDDPHVCALLEAHQRGMYAVSPPGTSFALDLAGLSGLDIRLFGCWEGGTLCAVGAVRRLSPDHAEVKSMRTRPDHLRKGAGEAVLLAIIDHARISGVARLSLETGTGEAFSPAVRLYTKHGFRPGEAFAGYANGPHNQCYHLALLDEPGSL
jgi:putative acetyltransferase